MTAPRVTEEQMPYDKLPPEQQAKDHLFRAIVHALRPFITYA